MKRKIDVNSESFMMISYIVCLILAVLVIIIAYLGDRDSVHGETETTTIIETTTIVETTTEEPTTQVETTTEKETEVYIPTTVRATESTTVFPEDTLELLALVTFAEAEGESEYGQRLVIDTILNRVDSSSFPNSVSGVVYQSGQFSCMWDGRSKRCVGRVPDSIRQLVKEELESRTNSEVLYFNGGGYPSWATPLFQEGNHYFSK